MKSVTISSKIKTHRGNGGTSKGRNLLLVLGILSILAGLSAMAAAQTNGVMVLNNMTIPRGGVWMAPNPANPAVGHFWTSDSVQGFCRVDPLAGANPPFQKTNCQGSAKSPGQAVVGPAPATLPAGTRYIYVADAASKSINVVRFQYNPNETLSNPLAMQVQNLTSVGGGAGGGRPVGLALDANGTDLYVAYLKSGDVMKVKNAQTATNATPTVVKIGSTSDGRGVNSLLMFKGDLYLAEIGGAGLSKISDPSGVTRPACGAPNAACTASSLNPQVTFAPGGMATDDVDIFIGEAPVNGTPGDILKCTPSSGVISIYSANVPSYTTNTGIAGFDVPRNAYAGPLSLAFAPNGDLYVGDDPTYSLVVAVLPTQQGHLWRVANQPSGLSIVDIAPNIGPSAGGTDVLIHGTGFVPGVGGAANQAGTQFFFGAVAATTVNCTLVTECHATSPAGLGTVDILASVAGAFSAPTPADLFTYASPAPPPTGPSIASIAPTSGATSGGTVVTISGANLISALGNATLVNFGANAATGVTCANATTCTAVSPAGTGTVDVFVTVDGVTSAATAADRFTYASPVANLYAWGITAPKGGMVFAPGALGGHWWSSDHSAGFCRQDPVPGTTLHAINYAVCDNGTIGSPGQAVYDARVNPAFTNATTGAAVPAGTHFIYVPDNAVKSTAVWRLTFDPTTETIIGAPEAMVPLADVRTLKPNGMALGPDGNLYITDLTETNIRQLTGPSGDPRLQTIGIVAHTGDGRGANGTIGFIGNLVYISENRAAASFDITQCPPSALGPGCATTPIPLPSGAFVAGVATDPVHNLVYAADSPGGANATIWRYNLATNTTSIYLTGGKLPAAGAPEATVYCALTCTRPWDPTLIPGGTAPFSFAFGIVVDPLGSGDLYVTEDATAGARGGRGHAWKAP